MGMGGDGRQRLIEQMPGGIMQARNPHSRIDQQVAVASPDMPDIALHDADHVGLPEPCDAVGQPLVLEPTLGNPQCHTPPPLLRRSLPLRGSTIAPLYHCAALHDHAALDAFQAWKAARISPLVRRAPLCRYSM